MFGLPAGTLLLLFGFPLFWIAPSSAPLGLTRYLTES